MNNRHLITQIDKTFSASSNSLILLDYDGTLVPFRDNPKDAAPDEELLSLLNRVHALPGVSVCIISGRSRRYLDEWFGDTKLLMVTEHGLWYRDSERLWMRIIESPTDWQDGVMEFLDRLIVRYPRTSVDRKEIAIVWHFRCCSGEIPDDIADDFHVGLADLIRQFDLQVLHGNDMVDIRPRNLNKGIAVEWIMKNSSYDIAMAIGDDKTDEDMFAVLDKLAVTVKVGKGVTQAQYHCDDYHGVRDLLLQLL